MKRPLLAAVICIAVCASVLRAEGVGVSPRTSVQAEPAVDVAQLLARLRQAVHDDDATAIERAYAELSGVGDDVLPVLAQSIRREEHTAWFIGLLAAGRAWSRTTYELTRGLPDCPAGGLTAPPGIADSFQHLAARAATALSPMLDAGDERSIHAAMEIIPHLGPAAVNVLPKLTALLGETKAEYASKGEVLDGIGCMGPAAASAIPQIVPLLHDQFIAKAAAKALVHIGPACAERLIDVLTAPADDEDLGVGFAHVYALLVLRDLGPALRDTKDELAPVVLARIADGLPVDCFAVQALESLDLSSRVLPVILADLRSASVEQRLRGLHRASCIEDRGALESALNDATNDPDPIVHAHATRLVRGEQASEAPAPRCVSPKTIEQWTKRADNGDASERASALRELASDLAASYSAQLPPAAVDVLRRSLAAPEPEIRRAAADALGTTHFALKETLGAEALQSALTDPDASVRAAIVTAATYGVSPTAEIKRVLADALKDPDQRVRERAQAVLDHEQIDDLLGDVLRTGDADARRRAAVLLAHSGPAEGAAADAGLEALASALRDSDAEVRAAAATAAMRWAVDPSPAGALLEKLRRDPSHLHDATARTRTQQNAEFVILQAFQDSSPFIRKIAATAAGRLGTAAIPALTTALGDPDDGVGTAAEEAFYVISRPAVAALQAAARSDDAMRARRASAALLWEWNWLPETLSDADLSALRNEQDAMRATLAAAAAIDTAGRPSAAAALEAFGPTLRALWKYHAPRDELSQGPFVRVPPTIASLLTQLKHQLRTAAGALLNQDKGAPNLKRMALMMRRALQRVAVNRDRHAEGAFATSISVEFQELPGHPDFIALRSTIDVPCGDDSSLYLFWRDAGHWKVAFALESNGYDYIGGAPGYFTYSVSPPADDGSFLVVSATNAPSCTSNWTSTRANVYRLTDPPREPVLITQQNRSTTNGRDPISVGADVNGYTLGYTYVFNLDTDRGRRERVEHYDLDGTQVFRARPIAGGPDDFVDEWVEVAWPTAGLSSDPSNTSLKHWHYALQLMDGLSDIFNTSMPPSTRCREGTQVHLGVTRHNERLGDSTYREIEGLDDLYFFVGQRSGLPYMRSVGHEACTVQPPVF